MIIYVTTIEKPIHLPNEPQYKSTTQWKFQWDGQYVYLEARGWKQPAETPEDVYKKITGYFYGTSYKIINVKEGFS